MNHTGDLPIYLKGPGYGFGLGVFSVVDPAATLSPYSPGTYGWGGAFTTHYFADPKEDMFGFYFAQLQQRDEALRTELQRLAMEAVVD